MRQSMRFFHMNTRNTLRPFLKGHILECLLCIGTVPRPVVTFSVTTFKYPCMYTHHDYFDTLKDLTLYYLRPSCLNFTLKETELSCSCVNLDYLKKKKTPCTGLRNIVINYTFYGFSTSFSMQFRRITHIIIS